MRAVRNSATQATTALQTPGNAASADVECGVATDQPMVARAKQ
jgi:hypothetical protein